MVQRQVKVEIPWEEMIEDRLCALEVAVNDIDEYVQEEIDRLNSARDLIRRAVDKVVQLSFRVANLEEGKPKFARFQDKRDATTMKNKMKAKKKRKTKY